MKDKNNDQKAFWWLDSAPPTKLLRKVTVVEGEQVNEDNCDQLRRLTVYTLTFEIPDYSDYQEPAIHHSKIQLDLGDVVKMVIPGYKPKSYSVSDLRDNEFDVTFKVYPNGRASGYLNSIPVGGCIQSFGKSANRRRNPGNFVGIISFGVGITEGLPIIKAELEKGDAAKIVLLWAARIWGDTFWHDELDALKEKYGKKLQVVFILSREEREGCLKGRITPEILDQVFQPEEKEGARFLSVGTKEMMKLAEEMLAKIGYDFPKHALLPKIKDKQ